MNELEFRKKQMKIKKHNQLSNIVDNVLFNVVDLHSHEGDGKH